jgi:hypothetical protein
MFSSAYEALGREQIILKTSSSLDVIAVLRHGVTFSMFKKAAQMLDLDLKQLGGYVGLSANMFSRMKNDEHSITH